MKVEPEQRAALLGEYIAKNSATVQAVLARNKAERHLRGGAATRRKYGKK